VSATDAGGQRTTAAQLSKEGAAQVRRVLENAYQELLAAAKVAVVDDGETLAVAAAAVDVAIEALMPPQPDVALAASSCHEALELARRTRAYAQGGNIANALDPARRKLEDALKRLQGT
jgi:hypothetical protein